MPTFDTPKPIHVEFDLVVANIDITAEDRADTVVTVEPSDPGDESDVEAAAETRVDLSGGELGIRGPRMRKYVGWGNKSRSVTVTIALPTGSTASGGGAGSVINVHGTGRLGACEFKNGMGRISLEQTGPAKLRTAGDVAVDLVDGDADLSTSMGKLWLGRATGSVHMKNSNGPSTVGEIGGSARLRSSNGEITVELARGDIDAVAAAGDIRIGELREGNVELKTAMGAIDIGVARNTTAWLDVHTGFGAVRSELDGAGEPGPDDRTVKVRARSSYGDIVIRRA